LDGSALTIDDKADAALYKRPGIMASDILAGNVTTSDESARRFLAAVTSSVGAQRTALQRSASAAPAPAAPKPQAKPAPGSAKSFPLSDPKPGEEPKQRRRAQPSRPPLTRTAAAPPAPGRSR